MSLEIVYERPRILDTFTFNTFTEEDAVFVESLYNPKHCPQAANPKGLARLIGKKVEITITSEPHF